MGSETIGWVDKLVSVGREVREWLVVAAFFLVVKKTVVYESGKPRRFVASHLDHKDQFFMSHHAKKLFVGASAAAAGLSPIVANPVLAQDGITGFQLDVEGGYAFSNFTSDFYEEGLAEDKGFDAFDQGYYGAIELTSNRASAWDWSASAMMWGLSNSTAILEPGALLTADNEFSATKLDFELHQPLSGMQGARFGVGMAYIDAFSGADWTIASVGPNGGLTSSKGFEGIGPQVSFDGQTPISNNMTFDFGGSAALAYGTGSKGFDAYESGLADDDDDDEFTSNTSNNSTWLGHLGVNAGVGLEVNPSTKLNVGVRYDLFSSNNETLGEPFDEDPDISGSMLFDDSIGTTTFYVGATIKF
jgi:hypothetical protein